MDSESDDTETKSTTLYEKVCRESIQADDHSI